MSASLSEFELIKHFFENVGPVGLDELELGIGDDCAIVNIPKGKSLCLSIDTMVEGVHFPHDCLPRHIASRALAAALSDLAAMGARPSHFTLSLTLPNAKKSWLSQFAEGLAELADRYQLSLVGGDTTRGPLAVALQVHGLVSKGGALQRSGAKPGDWLAVSGSLGDAGAALSMLDIVDPNPDQTKLLARYYYPTPRIDQGMQLLGLASACIDISDGLLADAGHLAAKSGIALRIDSEALPLSGALMAEFGDRSIDFAMSAGDDYELLFTISEQNWQQLKQQHPSHLYTLIGRVEKGEGVSVYFGGKQIQTTHQGFRHFE